MKIGSFAVVLFCACGSARGQYAIGVHGGPLLFQGLFDEASQALSDTHGWSAGIQFIEGSKGTSGFRFGLDLMDRAYALKALNEARMEDYLIETKLIQFSVEMRWPLSRKAGIFLNVGPAIGFEVHEVRTGESYYSDAIDPYYQVVKADGEVETGFSIRDGHWRIGVTLEKPIGGGWEVTGDVYASPGVGNWARGHTYATLDMQLRAGVIRRL